MVGQQSGEAADHIRLVVHDPEAADRDIVPSLKRGRAGGATPALPSEESRLLAIGAYFLLASPVAKPWSFTSTFSSSVS